ncbi:hypothetical protein HJG60_007953 [Phyllostomus discolor]|uniref:Uncharacterized protein n=1 Tax=Phyllostomus discolor TaxID=89673 RepID=A0A834BDG6_9CHIR|nr:hypothetical protein HJG60_007953 [Phyllostomus discolor]
MKYYILHCRTIGALAYHLFEMCGSHEVMLPFDKTCFIAVRSIVSRHLAAESVESFLAFQAKAVLFQIIPQLMTEHDKPEKVLGAGCFCQGKTLLLLWSFPLNWSKLCEICIYSIHISCPILPALFFPHKCWICFVV